MNKLKQLLKCKQSIKAIGAIVLIAFLAIMSSMYVADYNKKHASEMQTTQEKIEGLEYTNKTLNDKVNELQNQLADAHKEIDSKNQVIEKIQGNYDTLNKQIDKLILALRE
ncbi:hypothetical protein V6O07_23410 [Arthrospira platensis SPKY2]